MHEVVHALVCPQTRDVTIVTQHHVNQNKESVQQLRKASSVDVNKPIRSRALEETLVKVPQF
jgi:hypothetical protein